MYTTHLSILFWLECNKIQQVHTTKLTSQMLYFQCWITTWCIFRNEINNYPYAWLQTIYLLPASRGGREHDGRCCWTVIKWFQWLTKHLTRQIYACIFFDAFNKLCKRFCSICETGNLFRTARIIGWPGKVYASNDIWLVEVNGGNSTYKLVLYYTHRIVNTLNDRACQMGVL